MQVLRKAVAGIGGQGEGPQSAWGGDCDVATVQVSEYKRVNKGSH